MLPLPQAHEPIALQCLQIKCAPADHQEDCQKENLGNGQTHMAGLQSSFHGNTRT
jgi:hypothetical protein